MAKPKPTKQTKPKVILLVDADIVAFRNAAAVEKRTISVKHKSGVEKTFKNKTELKNLLKQKNKLDTLPDYAITEIQTAESVSHALHLCKILIKRLQQRTAADQVELYLGTGDVFRHNLPLPTGYKAGRSEVLKPVHLQETRDYLLKSYTTSLVRDLETDDVLTIKAYEYQQQGHTPIIASIDKDALQTQGIRGYNWTKDAGDIEPKASELDGQEFDVDEPTDKPVKPVVLKPVDSLGHLLKTDQKITGEGLMWLAYQTLAGDPTDGYQGYQLSNAPYGPTKAFLALKDCLSETEVLIRLIEQYKHLYPTEISYTDVHGTKHELTADQVWDHFLCMYWQCAYMRRSWDDTGVFWDYAKQYNVLRENYLNN